MKEPRTSRAARLAREIKDWWDTGSVSKGQCACDVCRRPTPGHADHEIPTKEKR